ncbi:amidohydrolase [Nocardia brevicatena]|uniref:amidohydrolase n=1 Tax=Nocardia brevicatena TaxID=37327 RepID=UPI0002F8561D|nr:amidohydrolase [Nocardia brevicatena]
MNSTASAVLAGLDEIRDDIENLYRDLHAHPELGRREHRTSAVAAAALRDLGYEVTEHLGTTGVVGVLGRGSGPTVMLRADMDALPVREATGLPYASSVTAIDRGAEQPVMHACGHDVHVACLIGFATLMARAPHAWQGTVVTLFQPSEENGDGARAMIEDGLTTAVPTPDVVFAQHVLPYPAGYVGTRSGPSLSAADSLRVTLHGRGGHGSQPQSAVDPIVMAAMCVLRLQTVVSRELPATTPAVLSVGSVHAGSGPNVIPDRAVLELNVRTYEPAVRQQILRSIERIVRAEAVAAGAPKEPEFQRITTFPPTVNDAATTRTVAAAFADAFGPDAHTMDLQTASEDMSEIPAAFGVPFTYWGIGGTDPRLYAAAARKGTISQDVPVNHSPHFAPVLQPTLDTGVKALTVATLAWLGT